MNRELDKIKKRIDFLAINKVNAFSPTISPAPKSIENNEIESVDEAIKYYSENDVKEIVVQKKYMGSYCDIYLKCDLSKTYFVSRNGYKIDYIDTEKAIKACTHLHSRFDWKDLDTVIIQAELMPWNVMGEKLIENDFYGYLDAHKTHRDYIKSSNLYDKVNKAKDSESFKLFFKDFKELDLKILKRKYPTHIIRQYKALIDVKILEMDSYNKGIELYEDQLSIFGDKGELYFAPFNVLKRIKKNGVEEVPNDNLSYSVVNDEEYFHFEIDTTEKVKEVSQKVKTWFNHLSSINEEGIMIKPRKCFVDNVPPALKVRNDKYLTMIYGVNFLEEYERNMKRRNIKRKLSCSINDWMINWKLLQIPYYKIQPENYYYKNLMLDRIHGETQENKLDKRL